PPLRGEGVVDGELRDEGLPCPRRRGHDHGRAFQDGEDRRDLEIVERIRISPGERPEQVDGVLGDTTGLEGCLDRRGGLVGQRCGLPSRGALYTEGVKSFPALARPAVLLLALAGLLVVPTPVGATHLPDHRFLVLGYVTDADGKPVAGARVVVTRVKTGLEYP